MSCENCKPKQLLTIAIVNLMPSPEFYQRDLESKLKAANPFVAFVWLKLTSKKYSSAQSNLADYKTWQHLDFSEFDAAIITGAPVEKLAFEHIDFWPELSQLISRVVQLNKPILGLCWGALAIGHSVGLRTSVHRKKIFGVFNLITASVLNKDVAMPFSTYASFEQLSLNSAVASGTFTAQYRHPSPSVGIVCLTSQTMQLTLCLGHPEYSAQRLADEWERDQRLADIELPADFTTVLSNEEWECDCTLFFKTWIESAVKYCQPDSSLQRSIEDNATLETSDQ